MLPTETFIDALTIVESAPLAHHRYGAALIMAGERASLMSTAERGRIKEGSDVALRVLWRLCKGDVASPTAPYLSPYLREFDLETLEGLAAFQAFEGVPETFTVGAGGHLHKARKPEGAYLASHIAALKSAVILNMGDAAFSAARVAFAEHFAAKAFFERTDIARYSISGTTDPGGHFQVHLRNARGDGYDANDTTDVISVPASGPYRVSFNGAVWSESTANPASIELSLHVIGIEVASFSASRPSADPGQHVEMKGRQLAKGDHLAVIDGPCLTTVTINGPLTIVNGGASTQRIAGVVQIWSDP